MVLTSLIVPIVMYAVYWKRDRTKVKLLDYGSCAFFLLFLVLFYIVPLSFLERYMTLVSNGFLALLILATILIKEPFTISYAKEITPKNRWSSPHFLKINNAISWIWFVYFVLCAGFGISNDQTIIDSQAIDIGGLVIAIYLTRKFPAWYMKKFAPELDKHD